MNFKATSEAFHHLFLDEVCADDWRGLLKYIVNETVEELKEEWCELIDELSTSEIDKLKDKIFFAKNVIPSTIKSVGEESIH